MKDHNTLRYLRPVDILELGAPLRLKKPTPADAAEAEFASWRMTAPTTLPITLHMSHEVFTEIMGAVNPSKFSTVRQGNGHYTIQPRKVGGILEEYNAANSRETLLDGVPLSPNGPVLVTGSENPAHDGLWYPAGKGLKSRNEALELAGWAVAPFGAHAREAKSAYDELCNEMMGQPYQSACLAQLASTKSVTVACNSNASKFADHIDLRQKQIAGAMGSWDRITARANVKAAVDAAVTRGATTEMIQQARYDAGVPAHEWAHEQRPEVAAQFLEIVNGLCTTPAQKETPTWRTARALRQLLTNVMGVDLSTVAGLPPPPWQGLDAVALEGALCRLEDAGREALQQRVSDYKKTHGTEKTRRVIRSLGADKLYELLSSPFTKWAEIWNAFDPAK